MKTTNPRVRLLAYGLGLAAILYNCKTKAVESVTPFKYTFKGLDDVKLPEVTPTAPAAVTVTPASVVMPAEGVAVTSGLASISATGQVPAVVQQAAADVGKVVTPDKAAAVSAAFTPAVLADLFSTGKLPADLQADVSSIAGNPALKMYLPVVTLPTVNGKAVGGRLAAPVTLATVNVTADADACQAAANAAFTTAKANLDEQLRTQSSSITNAYNSAVAAANGEVASCQAPLAAKYNAQIAEAQSTLNSVIDALNAARSTLGEAQYASLLVMSYVTFSQLVQSYVLLQAAEANACTLTKDAKVSAAGAARDADQSLITSNYNAALTNLTTARDQAVASCHNQGGGRKGVTINE